MSSNNPTPPLFKIIKNDYPSFLATIFPLVCVVGIIFVWVTDYFPLRNGQNVGRDILPFLLGTQALSLLICVPILVWRIRFIQKVFTTGQEVKGEVTSLFFHKDRGRVEYKYTLNDTQYQSGNAIMKNQQTQQMVTGTVLILKVNPDNPQQAFVRDLYL